MQWYVQVQNQAYGPYHDIQMQGFVSEGRVGETSLISNTPESGFYQAIAYDIFKTWSGTGQAVAVGDTHGYQQQATPYTQNQPVSYEQAQTPQSYVPESISEPVHANIQATPHSPTSVKEHTSVFLVMAEIRSDGAMGFLQALQSFGIAQRIGDTVWILRSASEVEQLRNALSQTLDRQDRLFILDSNANKTAWFNIGADLDNRIRELWNEDDD